LGLGLDEEPAAPVQVALTNTPSIDLGRPPKIGAGSPLDALGAVPEPEPEPVPVPEADPAKLVARAPQAQQQALGG
jgi:hypothetical protein